MQEERIKVYMEKLKQFYRNSKDEISFYVEYVMSEDEINLVTDIVYQYLLNESYEFMPKGIFNNRINKIFDIDNRRKKGELEIIDFEYSFYIPIAYYEDYSNLKTQEKKAMFRSGEWQYNFGGNFGFAKNHNYFFELIPVTQLFEENNEKLIPKKNYFDKILHRNKYFINNDSLSLAWLLENDLTFIETIVRVFGYDKELEINKATLLEAHKYYSGGQPPNIEVLEHLFADKDCRGNLHLREELIKTVEAETNVNQNNIIRLLEDYCSHLAISIKEIESFFSFDEKCKIIACINNAIYPIFKEHKNENGNLLWSQNSLLYNINIQHPEIIAEIVKNNYMGYPDLKIYIDELKDENEKQK